MKSEGINKVITIHPEGDVDVCTKFHGNPSSSCGSHSHKTSWWRWRKSQGIAKVSRLQPLGTLNICTKFYGNSSNNCQGMALKAKDVTVALQNKSPKSVGFILLGPWMSTQISWQSIRQLLRYFSLEPKWWTNPPIDQHWHPYSHATAMAKKLKCTAPVQSVHSAFLLSQQQNSRKRLSTPPLTGNDLHIYGHAMTGVTRHRGECLFRAGWGV